MALFDAGVASPAREFAVTGAAPIPVEAIEFFRGLGVPFAEVYGMSENTGAMTLDVHRVKPGAVGRPLIITAGGKNISPANLEAALKTIPLVGQACVIGDGRPYLSALLVLDPDAAPAWARSHGKDGADLASLAADEELHAQVAAQLEEVNARFSQVERIKRFSLLGEEWLPDSEVLTPTMKLKRRGVLERYADVIDGLYA